MRKMKAVKKMKSSTCTVSTTRTPPKNSTAPAKRFTSHSSTPVTNCSGTSISMTTWYVMLCSALNLWYALRWCGFGSPLKMP